MNVGDSERTIDLTPGATEGVLFDGMTADGSKVFFSSEEYLTGEDEQHTGADIFMWSQKGEEEGKPLTLISTGTEGGHRILRPRCQHPAQTLEHEAPQQNCGDVAIGGGGGVASGDGTIYFLSPEPARRLRRTPGRGQERPQPLRRPSRCAPHFVATLESSLTGPAAKRATPSSATSVHSPNQNIIAVDNSGGPSNGDVYVYDSVTVAIYKYNSSHELITSWGEHGKLLPGSAN